jgi:hypothetical protein
MTITARHKAVWEAQAVSSMSGCTNPFAGEATSLDSADTSSSSGSTEGAMLDGADTSSTFGSGEGDVNDMIDISSRDKEDVQVVISVSLIKPN